MPIYCPSDADLLAQPLLVYYRDAISRSIPVQMRTPDFWIEQNYHYLFDLSPEAFAEALSVSPSLLSGLAEWEQMQQTQVALSDLGTRIINCHRVAGKPLSMEQRLHNQRYITGLDDIMANMVSELKAEIGASLSKLSSPHRRPGF